MCDHGNRRQAAADTELTYRAGGEVGAGERGDHREDGAVGGDRNRGLQEDK